jgi:predicted NAD/FAD-dependent oxidoreductase
MTTLATMPEQQTSPQFNVAIVGCGITGAVLAHTLAQSNANVKVHVYDQGRSGPGGRASHRVQDGIYHFDHGCQFFRADTDQFKQTISDWLDKQWVSEWKGSFKGDGDFFGCPSQPPFYVGAGGMSAIPVALARGRYECNSRSSGRCSRGHRPLHCV